MFIPDDFADSEIAKMLGVIIMNKMGKPPLTNFHRMLTKDRTIFHKEMNAYIKSFPDNDWNEKLTQEFQNVCCDEIFNEDFQPAMYEPLHINNEIVRLETG